jgi:transcriptional regulator with XRE-family HTH domain
MTDFGGELRRLISERGLSLNETARRVPCDRGYLSKVARGCKRPSAELKARLDDVLGAGGALASLDAEPDQVDDLGLIELARRAGSSDVGGQAVELLAGAADSMCRDYPVMGAAELSARAREHLRYTTGLLGKRMTLGEHRELLVTAGWLSALLACTLYDAGNRAAARTARTMGRQFAEQAGHGELAAWSFEIGAWFALVEGRYAETVTLSQAGLAHAGVSSAGVQLALQAARGYARMGDRQAHGALREGRAILDRLPVPAHPEHHFAFDGAKFEFYAGSILTWLGDDIPAAEHARYVVAMCTEGGRVRWPMRLAISQLDLALVAARRGALDEAVTLGSTALGHQRHSAQLLPRAAELGRELAGRYPGERLAAEFADQLDGQRRDVTGR